MYSVVVTCTQDNIRCDDYVIYTFYNYTRKYKHATVNNRVIIYKIIIQYRCRYILF